MATETAVQIVWAIPVSQTYWPLDFWTSQHTDQFGNIWVW
jgi:hypothetical protein